MARRKLQSLAVLVREKRGNRGLREAAKEIGVSAPTLMRVENGRIPDVTTFGRICDWLEVSPGDFISEKQSSSRETKQPDEVSAHLRTDRALQLKTAQALARMILLAMKHQPIGSKEG